MAGTKQLVTTKEAAAVLRMNPWTLYKAARRGKYPFHRVGERGVRFDIDELLALTRRDGHE
jgi:excisionase family DNA binding protein